jgi:hypothetical protein
LSHCGRHCGRPSEALDEAVREHPRLLEVLEELVPLWKKVQEVPVGSLTTL